MSLRRWPNWRTASTRQGQDEGRARMKGTPTPSLGWDLAGYGDSGSALCRADRTGDTITATILRASFICRPRHAITADIQATADVECEMLRRFAKIGGIYLDVPIDL